MIIQDTCPSTFLRRGLVGETPPSQNKDEMSNNDSLVNSTAALPHIYISPQGVLVDPSLSSSSSILPVAENTENSADKLSSSFLRSGVVAESRSLLNFVPRTFSNLLFGEEKRNAISNSDLGDNDLYRVCFNQEGSSLYQRVADVDDDDDSCPKMEGSKLYQSRLQKNADKLRNVENRYHPMQYHQVATTKDGEASTDFLYLQEYSMGEQEDDSLPVEGGRRSRRSFTLEGQDGSPIENVAGDDGSPLPTLRLTPGNFWCKDVEAVASSHVDFRRAPYCAAVPPNPSQSQGNQNRPRGLPASKSSKPKKSRNESLRRAPRHTSVEMMQRDSQMSTSKYRRNPYWTTTPQHGSANVAASSGSQMMQMSTSHRSNTKVHHSTNQQQEEETYSNDGGVMSQWCGILGILSSQPILSVMLIFVPCGITSYWCQWGDALTFSLNFLAIIPMAWLMGKCTEEISAHLGQIAGGLLNAWFGNVVEMLLCIAGLRRGELVVVRSTLIGSILSNLLLVTGCSFLFGGFRHKVQEFSAIGASTNSSLMTLSCMCLGLPTIYATILSSASASELQISRCVSFFLIFIYIQYLIFQLGTHSFLFADEDDEEPELSVYSATGILLVCSIFCSFCSDYLVSSITGVVNTFNLSKEFIGIILLPIVGNAAEHYTSVIVAMRNKMDLSLACAVGSSCQMALFVTPFTVLVGWIIGQPMSLDLHAFELLVLVMSVLIITSILQDGYSHWLEGSMLVSAYCVIAIIYFFEEPQFSEII